MNNYKQIKLFACINEGGKKEPAFHGIDGALVLASRFAS